MKKSKLRVLWQLCVDTYLSWHKNNPAMMAAAISYFAIFSIVPLVILTIVIGGQLLGQERAQEQILQQAAYFFSDEAALSIKELLEAAQRGGVGLASFFSGILILFGASRALTQLQHALNSIWKVEKAKKKHVLIRFILARATSFVMVLATCGFILFLFTVDTGVQVMSSVFSNYLPLIPGISIFKLIYSAVSFAIYVLLFALIYRYVPEAEVSWKDVWIGAMVTAVLFFFGRGILGLYFRLSHVASLYGAAGCLVIILLWVYFTTQIFLFGAVFTWVYANKLGSRSPRDSAGIYE